VVDWGVSPMKILQFSAFLIATTVWAQSPAPKAAPAPAAKELPPDTVIATFGKGETLTIGELKSFFSVMPPQMQQTALRDRKAFVQQFALMHRLAEMAEAAKLDQRSPVKESLAFNRMYLMMNAQLENALSSIQIPRDETQAYYEKNKDRFTEAKVKAIYISFAADPAKDAGANGQKKLTEAEAQAKIEKLRAEILGGADFVKLVKQYSEDHTSADKDGDFGTIRRTDKLPDAIRKAIFALKPGEVSEPVRQPNGFYLFRVEELTPQPYSEVQADIFSEMKQARFKAWMEEVTRNLNLKFENEQFFSGGGAATTASK
jgi:peptidyl-prolyl cis-trans isomerase C